MDLRRHFPGLRRDGERSGRRLPGILLTLPAVLLLAACGGGDPTNVGGPPDDPPRPPPPPPPDTTPAPDSVPIFPGAEGFGVYTPGGRGGRVIAVTSLADAGPGTLREALEATGPRIVVFRVAGTILLQSQLFIDQPFVTVAGQSAPGGGIQIRAVPGVSNALVQIETHDVVLRHLRIRPGPSDVPGGALGRDAVLVNGPSAHHVVLDHLSLEWAEDKALVIFGGATDVTVQWSILAETLYCANHTKTVDPARFDTFGPCPTGGAPHSRAVTISTTPNGGTPPDRISMHHNLFAHNNKRHPNVVSQTLVDFVNNVVYDLGDLGANLGLKPGNPGPVRLNYVRNWVAAGPGTVTGVHMVSAPQNTAEGALQVWLEGNQIEGPIEAVPDFFATRGYLAGERHAAPPITESMPVAARDAVLQGAGQTLPVRDAVDARIAGEVLSGAGRFVDDPSQVGGWPDPAAGPPPADADGDGMPDAWEAQHGLDPAAAADAVDDPDRDGYTNVEEFLNGTDPTRRNG